jgi:uncharacterized protein YcaQ
LKVIAAHCEDHVQPAQIAAPLFDELRRLADWLELKRVVLGRRGPLCKSLRTQMTATG